MENQIKLLPDCRCGRKSLALIPARNGFGPLVGCLEIHPRIKGGFLLPELELCFVCSKFFKTSPKYPKETDVSPAWETVSSGLLSSTWLTLEGDQKFKF